MPRRARISLPGLAYIGVLLSLLITTWATPAQAQIQMTYYDFQNNAPIPSTGETTVDMSVNAGATAVARVGNISTTTFVTGAFGYGLGLSSNNWSAAITDPGLGATNYYQFEFSSARIAGVQVVFNSSANSTGPGRVGLIYSIDNGATWSAIATQTTSSTFAARTFTLGANANGQSRVMTRIYAYADGNTGFTSAGTYAIDNLQVRANTATASLDLIDLAAYGFRTRGFPVVFVSSTTSFTVTNPGTVVRLGSDFYQGLITVGAGATLDLNGHGVVLGGASLTLNGTLAGSGTSYVSLGNATVSGSGSLGTAADPFPSLSCSGALTLSMPAFIHTTYLYKGSIGGVGVFTVTASGARPARVEVGGSGPTIAGGSFVTTPQFSLGSAGLDLVYRDQTARTVGFELPPSRALHTLELASPAGLLVNGGMVDCDSLVLTSGALAFGPSGGASISDGGALVAAAGDLAAGVAGGRVQFEGAGRVSGVVHFNDVSLQNQPVDFGPSSTVNGVLDMAFATVAPGGAPTYGPEATLLYTSDSAIGDEWATGSSGPQVPPRVEIQNGKLVRFGTAAASSPRTVLRSLVIGAASSLELGALPGGDLHLHGDLTVNGEINSNGRRVVFDGPGPEQHFYGDASNNTFSTFEVLELDTPGRTLLHGALRIGSALRLMRGSTWVEHVVHIKMAPGAELEVTGGRFEVIPLPPPSADSLAYAGYILFEGDGRVSGRADLSAVVLEGGAVDMGTDTRMFRTLSMAGGAIANHHSPTYSRGSTIAYHNWNYPDVTIAVRGDEWSRYSGPAGWVILSLGVQFDAGGSHPTEPLVAQGSLSMYDGAVFNMNVPGHECTAPLTVGGSLYQGGKLELSSLPGGDLHLHGNWVGGTFVSNGRRVNLVGDVPQTLRIAKTFTDLTLDNPAGAILSDDTYFGPNDITVTNQLELLRGNIITNQNVVRFGATGGVVRASSGGHVIGNVQKLTGVGPVRKLTFDVGKKTAAVPVAALASAAASPIAGDALAVEPGDDTGYAPVEITLTDVTTEGSITVTTEPADDTALGTSGFDPARVVHRNWNVTNQGAVFANAAIGVGFPSGDVSASADPGTFGVRVFDGSGWRIGGSAIRTPNSTVASGFTTLGRVSVGNPYLFVIDAQAGAQGSVSPSGAVSVEQGTDQVFTITPDAGSLVEDVIVDGTSLGAVTSYTFTNVTAAHTLTASFVDANHPPTLSVPDTLTVNEGAVVAFSAVATDPESAVQTLTFSLVAPSPANATVDGSTGQVQWTPVDNGSAVIRVRVSDGFSATEANVRVGVLNVAPTASIVSPSAGALYALGDAATFTGTYADAGAADTHTAMWIVDGQTVTAVVNTATRSVSASWSAPGAGVYAVRLVVTDDDGGEGQATLVEGFDAMVVVYDPAAGFVTGGGWFQSPAGAYRADTTLAGKASFGFVSKYARGASVPTGATEFQFKAANFRFHSSAYEWLVVAGERAQYRGTGSVNGVAGHAFMLTATDGDLVGGVEPDRMRIRIWNVASGGIAYDNQHGESDSADPVTVLGGGSIVIHQTPAGNGRGTQPAGAQALPVAFAVHAPTPNPSRAGAALALDLPQEADVTATVVDVTGREIEQLHRGTLPAGRHEIRWSAADRTGRRVAAGMYFVRVTSLRAGSPGQSAVRKVIMQ